MSKGKYVCPNCGSENILSVPQQYERGHAEGVVTRREKVGYSDTIRDGKVVSSTPIYGDVSHPTYSDTDLAKRLAPPRKPVPPTPPVHKRKMGCIVIALFIMFGLTIPEGLLQLFLRNDPSEVCISIGFMLIVYLLWRCFPKFGKQKRLEQEEREAYERAVAAYPHQMEEYNKRLYEWQHSYICERCNSVFPLY